MAPTSEPDLPPRIQFSLGSILVFFVLSALLLGLGKAANTMGAALLGIGFYAFMLLLSGVMGLQRRRGVAVYRAKSEADAAACRNFLESQGIPAVRVEGQDSALPGMLVQPTVVVVPPEHAEQAWKLLAECDESRRA
jgi:hypothetical protein